MEELAALGASRRGGGPGAFVLNFCDTGYGNDPTREGHVPALLELLGIPYSGSGPACLHLCYDKVAVRTTAAALGVPVPSERIVPADADVLPDDLSFPVLVKPRTGDGSVGIDAGAVVRSTDRLGERIARLRTLLPGRDLLVQEFLEGTEYAVGLVGNPDDGLEALPVLEVDYGGLDPGLDPILSYESKTDPASPYWTDIRYRPATLDRPGRSGLVGPSERLFRWLGCRDYARFDFRCDADGTPRLLEANPNPAWCWDGKMNLMAGFAGTDTPGFLASLLEAAQRRVARELGTGLGG